jgi:hypothetical protein
MRGDGVGPSPGTGRTHVPASAPTSELLAAKVVVATLFDGRQVPLLMSWCAPLAVPSHEVGCRRLTGGSPASAL